MKNSNTKTVKMVKFKYKTSPEHRTYYANGAYGGYTGKGDIKISFFIESPEYPTEEMYTLVEEKLKPTKENEDLNDINRRERDIQTSILLSIETADAIAKWLTQKVEEWNKLNDTLKKSSDKQENEDATS